MACRTLTVNELAQRLNCRLQGDGSAVIDRIASLEEAQGGAISFLTNPKFADQVQKTAASAVIVPDTFQGSAACSLLFTKQVEQTLEDLLRLFAPEPDFPPAGIAASAVVANTARIDNTAAIGPNAVIGDGAAIGPHAVISAGCVIGRDAVIGSDTILYPNVTVYPGCRIGNRVIIHANSTIGADGFGYRMADGKHQKIPHIGIVVIEDEVEIGANACVDRAKFGQTTIGRGTKIDNLVQIAHNVKIGEHCIIVSQTGIAGSAQLGKYVVLGGQCGIRDHAKIGDGVMAAATTAVDRDIEPGQKIAGTPAKPALTLFRELTALQKLPDLIKEVKRLKEEINQRGTAKNSSQTDSDCR